MELCDQQILKTKKARMIEALRGLWRKEHLFALGLALDSYQFYQKQIKQCDEHISEVLREMSGGKPMAEMGKPKELRHNALEVDNLRVQMGQTNLQLVMYFLCGFGNPRGWA